MSMEEIIRAWKADEEALDPHMPASPVGHELSEQELLEVNGLGGCPANAQTCQITCAWPTCTKTDKKPLTP